MAKWQICAMLLMTFDLSQICKHYAKNKTNVFSYVHAQFHPYIHYSSLKSAFSAKISIFAWIMAPDDLWPLQKVIIVYIFETSFSHTTTVASFKFLCPIVSEKSAMFNLLGRFCTNYGPLWPLTFALGNKTMQFWKALIKYYHHAKFHGCVINSLWEKLNMNFFFFFFFLPACLQPTNPNAMHQYIDSFCFMSS